MELHILLMELIKQRMCNCSPQFDHKHHSFKRYSMSYAHHSAMVCLTHTKLSAMRRIHHQAQCSCTSVA